jgi:hypothetical protein
MAITREDLKNMYIEHLNAEKVRIAKMVEEEINLIVKDILNENKLGRQIYRRKCYELREDYLTILFTRLQELFVDSKITTNVMNDIENAQKYIVINIDWS